MLSPGISPAAVHAGGFRSYDADGLPPLSSPGAHFNGSRIMTMSPQSIQPIAKIETTSSAILRWFNYLIDRRKLLACASIAATSLLVLFPITLAIQLSIIHPFVFVLDTFHTTFSLSTWICLFISAFFVFGSQFAAVQYVVIPTQRKRVSLRYSWNWFVSMLLFVSNSISIGLLIHIASADFNGFGYFLLYSCVLYATIYTFFWTDHQLNFAQNTPQLGFFYCIQSMFSTSSESVLMQSVRQAANIYKYTYLFAFVAGVPIFGAPAMWSLFDFTLHLACLLFIFYISFVSKAAVKLIRMFVMKPVCFPLPPPFVIHSPNEAQLRNMCNVMDVSDPLVKLFAFFDLRRVAWSDKTRRLEIFSLSQPGGHPRNWTSVCNACVSVIEQIRATLEVSASQMSGISTDEEEPDREMLMMPNAMRNQIYPSAVRQRQLRVSMRPLHRPPPPTKVAGILPVHWYKKIFGWTDDEILIISRYDSNIAVLAIESLYMLCVESFDEDKYGVVQRDLARVVALLLSTIKTIDKYFRARNARLSSEAEDLPIKSIDNTLQTAIYRLNAKFGAHFKALNLTSEEFALIDMLC